MIETAETIDQTITEVTKCRFCNKRIVLENLSVTGLKDFGLSRFIEHNIACERCGTYKRKLRDMKATLHWACSSLAQLKLMKWCKKVEEETESRDAIIKSVVIKMSRLMCSFYGMPAAEATQWIDENDFSDAISASPSKYVAVLRMMESGIKRQSQSQAKLEI